MCHFDELKLMQKDYPSSLSVTECGSYTGPNVVPFLRVQEGTGSHKTSFAPPRRHSDMEFLKWSTVPNDVRGKHVSLDELAELFPQDETHSEIKILEDKDRYRIYGHAISTPGKFDLTTQLAYECKNCNSIFVGSPVIEDENSIGIQPLAGREGFDAYCMRCHSHLYESTWKIS